jgi:cysteine synthase A
VTGDRPFQRSVSTDLSNTGEIKNKNSMPGLEKFDRLWTMVGNTPMIGIRYGYQGKMHSIFAKCEHYNLTGSIKDRMALYILQRAYENGGIRAGGRIVEASSGNTGIAFAAIGRALGHPVTIIIPDWLSRERKQIIRSLGADIKLVSRKNGGFQRCIEKSLDMAAADRTVFLPKQFDNGLNCEAHERTTGPEIWRQLASIGLKPDGFVAGVGTGGTVMGMNHFLRSKDPAIRVHPVEPLESPTLSTGHKCGDHRIQGISDEFIPSIVSLEKLNRIIPVSDGDAILMAQKMAWDLGLAVGISSGANILGAIRLQQELGVGSVVVTVLADSNKKYLSTALMQEEPVKPGYLTPSIDLLEYLPIMERSSALEKIISR